MYRYVKILVVSTLLAGCASYTPAPRPEAPLEIPTRFSMYTEGESIGERWWEAFGSPELNRMVDTALSGNFDIRSTLARLRQADAVLRKAGAELLPTIDFETSGEFSRQQTRSSSHGRSVTLEEKSWYGGLVASYEVDLWGRLRAERQTEALNFEAAREDLATARMTVAASVVQTWVDLLSINRQIAILNKQIRTNQDLLDLQKLRFANGKASALDVSQQQEELAAAKAQMPLLRISENQLRSSLAILLGKAACGSLDIEPAAMPELIALPAAGVPADLLAARPDVRAAGLRLRSADWSVAAARTDRLPTMTLSAAAAFSSGSLDLLFDNWILKLAGSIAGPVFDANSRKAEVDRTRAVAEEYLAAYAKTVAEAIREVEDNMAEEKRQEEYISLLQDQLKASRMSVKDARLQYLNGKSDYLSYLAAWNSVQSLERQVVGERATQIKYRVALYRALGGNWTGGEDASPL